MIKLSQAKGSTLRNDRAEPSQSSSRELALVLLELYISYDLKETALTSLYTLGVLISLKTNNVCNIFSKFKIVAFKLMSFLEDSA
jgi:hypothetical protein